MATIRLGDEAPNFTAQTSEGKIDFHDWLGDSWGVLFSHPADYTPVCTTELGAVAKYKDEFDITIQGFRYFNVYGDRSPTKGQYAPVVGLFFRQVEAGEAMTIVGDGEQRRDYTHVSDIVNANILAALSDNKKVVGEIFNVGTGRNHSVNELAKLIGMPYKYIPARQGEARVTLADNSKLREMLGWEPTVKFEDWIEENKPKI